MTRGGKAFLNSIKEIVCHDGLVLAGIGGALMHGLAEIDPVLEEAVEGASIEGLVAVRLTAAGRPDF